MGIFYENLSKTFYLESKDVTYAFKISEYGFLQHLYFGKRIRRDDLSHTVSLYDRGHGTAIATACSASHSLNNYANECPAYGRSDFRESMIAVTDSLGVRVGDWKYVGHKIFDKKPPIDGIPSVRGGETLRVEIFDEKMGVSIYLYYTVYEDLPVIARRAEIVNKSNSSVCIDRAYSFNLDLDDGNYDVLTLTGAHLRERATERGALRHGVFFIDSKRGESSAQANPFIAVMRKDTNENVGEVYSITLVYSGDFILKTQIEENDTLRITGGINDHDFSWTLGAGETFSTPEAIITYTDKGLGDNSRALHDLYRKYLLNEKYAYSPRPIVLNSWESIYMDYDEKKIIEIIDNIKNTGIDTFVLDDGWFGARNDDKSSLGDWFVNRQKFPNGLKAVADHVHKCGLKFGLWFEPEMISEKSELYRAHPDWVLHVDGLKPCNGRNQYVLDLTRDEICEHVVDTISKIIEENGVDYIKWDMNRPLTENYSARLNVKSKETHHRYILGLYKILEKFTEKFPNVFFEGCASGGCRMDAAMLRYFPQIWVSDNSDAYSRSLIQYGTSMCYPLSAMSNHVSICPNHQCGRVTPIDSRAEIAMLGAFGYELDVSKLSDEDRAKIGSQIAEYKKVSKLVLEGDLYRLSDPFNGDYFAEMTVSKDKSQAKLTAMRSLYVPNGICKRIYPKGLDENAVYEIEELSVSLYGSTIMNAGLVVELPFGDFQSVTYHFNKL